MELSKSHINAYQHLAFKKEKRKKNIEFLEEEFIHKDEFTIGA